MTLRHSLVHNLADTSHTLCYTVGYHSHLTPCTAQRTQWRPRIDTPLDWCPPQLPTGINKAFKLNFIYTVITTTLP